MQVCVLARFPEIPENFVNANTDSIIDHPIMTGCKLSRKYNFS